MQRRRLPLQAVARLAPGANYSDIFPNNQIPARVHGSHRGGLHEPVCACCQSARRHLSDCLPEFTRTAPTSSRSSLIIASATHKTSSAYYYFNDSTSVRSLLRDSRPAAPPLWVLAPITKERYQQWNLTHNWTLSNNLVNEAHFTYFREAQGNFLHPQRTTLVQDSCATVPAG